MTKAKTKDKEKPPRTPDKKLNVKQELFCQLYVNNPATFGNATRSYAQAYGIDLEDYEKIPKMKADDPRVTEVLKRYKVAQAGGAENLSKPLINLRIQELFNGLMTDTAVDAEHAKVIFQDNDLTAKLQGIREYNRVKQRVIRKVDVKGTFSLTELLDAADE